MTHTPKIELVIFDLGGVMVRLARRWKFACQMIGIETPPVLDDPATLAAIEQIVDPSERGHISNEEFDQRVAKLVGLTPDQVHQLCIAWLVGPYPGIAELVDRLAVNGLQLGCLSNTNDRHWSLMHAPGNPASLPMHRLHHHFASHIIGLRKPEPGIYAHVEQHTGVAPERIVFFDDNAPNIDAAKARGWRGIRVDPDRPVEQMTEHLTALRCLS